MDRVAVFAEAVASLVNAYESAKSFQGLVNKMISAPENLKYAGMREWASGLRETTEHKEMIELTLMVRELAGRGEAERRMCREILESILRYSENKTETGFLSF